MDSVTGAPVPEAVVALMGLSGLEKASTYSDSRGVFLLRAPEPGQYRLVATSDAYRRSVFPPFALAGQQMRSYALLLPATNEEEVGPSVADVALATQRCEGDEGTSTIVGAVRRPSGEAALGALVYFSTPRTTVADSVDSQTSASFGVVEADSEGNYAICDLPIMSRISLYATASETISAFHGVMFGTGGVFAEDAFHSLSRPVWRQNLQLLGDSLRNSALAGLVVDTGGSPVAGASVEIVGSTFRARTDEAGRFQIDNLSMGNVRLRVRSVGYSPTEIDVDLVPNATTNLPEDALALVQFSFRLADITVYANPGLEGFYDRRENSPRGRFVTETEWQNQIHFEVSDILDRTRYTVDRQRYTCSAPTSIFLDGVYIYLSERIGLDDFVDPTYLAAIEAYGTGYDAPNRYRRHGCGPVVLLWSK